MGYSSNNNFFTLTDNQRLVIDGCGGTYEDKYYVNGTYIDLCGLPIEEYMKNPCCGGNNSGSEDYVKPKNEILVKAYTSEDGTIYYQAFSKFAVTSNIKIMVLSNNNIGTELDLYIGDTTSKPEIGETFEFMNVTLSVYEDDTYQYVSVMEESKSSYDIYNKAILLTNIGLFSEDFNMTTMDADSTIDINFTIPAGTINYNEFETNEEFLAYCNEHQYCLSLYIPKEIYDKNKYLISNYGGTDVTKNFAFNNYTTILDNEYACIVEKAKDDIMPFVQLYNEELVYEYKLTLNN